MKLRILHTFFSRIFRIRRYFQVVAVLYADISVMKIFIINTFVLLIHCLLFVLFVSSFLSFFLSIFHYRRVQSVYISHISKHMLSFGYRKFKYHYFLVTFILCFRFNSCRECSDNLEISSHSCRN